MVGRPDAESAASLSNWQTVLFVGYGDESELDEATDRLDRVDRSFFVKLSYAFQR